MAEICRRPGIFIVAGCTVGRKLCELVVGICCAIVIRQVTPCTGIGCIDVIAVVAGCTIVAYGCVGTVEGIVVIVNRERCRTPPGCRGVAHNTVIRQLQCLVIGIDRLIKVRAVTTNTCCICPLKS